MAPAETSALAIVAYLALFATVGIVFLFVNLLIGRFLRTSNPREEKRAIYECGEPTIGSAFVQFDLRFYVVALLFIIFDVEVAFFFPWATSFGKAIHLADPRLAVVDATSGELTREARLLYRELGVRDPRAPVEARGDAPRPATGDAARPAAGDAVRANEIAKAGARQLVWLAILDIGIFFAVLMVGFAYVWKRGDLDWVRAIDREAARRTTGSSLTPARTGKALVEEPVYSL